MKYVNVINFTTVFIHTVFFFSFKLLSITKSVIVQHVSILRSIFLLQLTFRQVHSQRVCKYLNSPVARISDLSAHNKYP